MSEIANPPSIEAAVYAVLRDVARLRVAPGPTDDLYAAGLSSLATVDLMLAIEDWFGIEFTSEWLNRRTFGSVAALCAAVQALQQPAP